MFRVYLPTMTPVLGALYERAWTSWARWRYRAAFGRSLCLLPVRGYPRSGHSLLARCSMPPPRRDRPRASRPQLVLSAAIAKRSTPAFWRAPHGSICAANTSNYAYQGPEPVQGRFEHLRVVGDKRGWSAALAIGEHPNPNLLNRLRVCEERYFNSTAIRSAAARRHSPQRAVAAPAFEHRRLSRSLDRSGTHDAFRMCSCV